ncbi:Hypothetical protein HDN1F_15780 [gamma proteobacterium HdN1]|nr:Hypothetical protein HDN1F_15780 [gamma proteobacterium HdN1]
MVATGGALGALGALGRWALAMAINFHVQSIFPWATLAVNLLGSVAFGLIYSWSLVQIQWQDPIRILFLTGFMGAFTTFSTFSFETFKLLEHGKFAVAALNVLASVALCVLGCWAGSALGKQIFN